MDLKQFAIEAERIYLADLSPEFEALEGEIELENRVWVSVRQATQSDNVKRADLYAERETRYTADPQGRVNAVSDVFKDNGLRRQMFETYWTLSGVGNLQDGDKPHFPEMPAKKIKLADFERLWGELPPAVADAIHRAVLQVNPDWDGGAAGK